MYELRDSDIFLKLLTAKFASKFPFGLIPSLFFQVHSPNSALPSFANREAPHPLSIIACAIIMETGILFTLISNSFFIFFNCKLVKLPKLIFLKFLTLYFLAKSSIL